MGMSLGNKGGAMANINITPYIDILLVLLIIFMVITPVDQLDLKVKVPQAPDDSTAVAASDNVIVVSIDEKAQIRINSDPHTLADLGAALQKIYSERWNKNMFVNASPKLTYSDVVRIIDIAKGAGVQDIGLMTEEIR